MCIILMTFHTIGIYYYWYVFSEMRYQMQHIKMFSAVGNYFVIIICSWGCRFLITENCEWSVSHIKLNDATVERIPTSPNNLLQYRCWLSCHPGVIDPQIACKCACCNLSNHVADPALLSLLYDPSITTIAVTDTTTYVNSHSVRTRDHCS